MKNTILIIIIIILSAILLKQFDDKKKVIKERDNIIKYENDSITYWKTKNGDLIAERMVLIGDRNTLEYFYNQTLDSNKVLREMIKKKDEVETITIVEQETLIDTIYLPIKDNRFDIKTPYYEITGGLSNDSISIDRLYIPNKVSLTTTTRKGITTIRVNNSNSYIQSSDIQSYIHKEIPRNKIFGVGIQVGYDVIGLEPYIGIGVSYNLFNF